MQQKGATSPSKWTHPSPPTYRAVAAGGRVGTASTFPWVCFGQALHRGLGGSSWALGGGTGFCARLGWELVPLLRLLMVYRGLVTSSLWGWDYRSLTWCMFCNAMCGCVHILWCATRRHHLRQATRQCACVLGVLWFLLILWVTLGTAL